MPKKSSKHRVPRTPADREAVVLQILLGRDRYGLELCELYEKETGQRMPIGSIYALTDGMAAEGWLTSYMGEQTHERGGNRRKYFHAEGKAAGAALDRYRDAMNSKLGLLGKLGAVLGWSPEGCRDAH